MEDQKLNYKPNIFLRILRILLILSFLVYVITGFLMHIDMRSDKEKERDYRDSIAQRTGYSEAFAVVESYIKSGGDEARIQSVMVSKYRGDSKAIVMMKTTGSTLYFSSTGKSSMPISSSTYQKLDLINRQRVDQARAQANANSIFLSGKLSNSFVSPLSESTFSGKTLSVIIKDVKGEYK